MGYSIRTTGASNGLEACLRTRAMVREDTLAVWSERDRPIESGYCSVVYTRLPPHTICQEDFPFMPTVSASFDLKPVNYFERNPILGVPPNFENDLPVCKAAVSA
ncbi:hypothetical protein SLA2020_068200 [Shorea laevis]